MKVLVLWLLGLAPTALPPGADTPQCPPTFREAKGACNPRVSACAYPEGRCSCARTTPCSGVPQPPGAPAWKCVAARTDGCPNDAPAQGAACAKPGQTCSYGDCGSLAYSCDQKSRTWFISGGVGPPPSAPGGVFATGPNTTTTTPTPSPPVAQKRPLATPKPPPAWKQCPKHRRFGCETRSQGIAPAPGEIIPQVCGCIPTCPPSRSVLISQDGDGAWPDGTRKGRFSCAASGLP